MLVLLQNKITSRYLDTILSGKDNLVLNVSLDDTEVSEKIESQMMYYDKAIIKVQFKKEYNLLSGILERDTSEVKVVLCVSDMFEKAYINNLLERKKKAYKTLTLKSIPEATCKVIISDIFQELYDKTFKDDVIEILYNHLKYSSKVDSELRILSRFSTLKELRNYIKQSKKIRNNTYVYKLLTHDKSSALGSFLIQNLNNLNYIFKILENFVDSYLSLYPFIHSGELRESTIKDFLKDRTDKYKNYLPSQLKQYIGIGTKLSYESMFILNKRIKQSKSRLDKLMIYKELLTDGYTNIL